jgi:hypothetical protein
MLKLFTWFKNWLEEINKDYHSSKDNFDDVDNWSTDEDAPYYTDGQ